MKSSFERFAFAGHDYRGNHCTVIVVICGLPLTLVNLEQ